MDISSLFSTFPGVYITQAFYHSLTAAVVTDMSLHAWAIASPAVRQRFRLIPIIVPVFTYPLFQLLNPERGSMHFRLDALFDSGRWLSMVLWEKVPLGIFLIMLLALTALIFLLQELIPIMRHSMGPDDSDDEWERPEEGSPVLKALEGLDVARPDVFIVDDEEPLIFSSTGGRQAVFLSTGLVSALSPRELRAAMAHEVEHIRRSRRPLLIFTYLARVLMFFNPVALVEFRRVVQEEEKICDDSAVRLTGSADAMAGALNALRHETDLDGDSPRLRLKEMAFEIEHYSHEMLLESRVFRLQHGGAPDNRSAWPEFAATLAVVMAINYFVV